MWNLGDDDKVNEGIGYKEDAAYGEGGLRPRERWRYILFCFGYSLVCAGESAFRDDRR